MAAQCNQSIAGAQANALVQNESNQSLGTSGGCSTMRALARATGCSLSERRRPRTPAKETERCIALIFQYGDVPGLRKIVHGIIVEMVLLP